MMKRHPNGESILPVRLKLWAVGTEDPNPENWNAWDQVAIVVAQTKEEAIRLNNLDSPHAVELIITKMEPGLLVKSEPYEKRMVPMQRGIISSFRY